MANAIETRVAELKKKLEVVQKDQQACYAQGQKLNEKMQLNNQDILKLVGAIEELEKMQKETSNA